MRIDAAREFTKNCDHCLPGETRETIEQTIRFATEMNPHTIQVSIAAPYPGTLLHRQALENNRLDRDAAELVDEHRRTDRSTALSPLHQEIFHSVEAFYSRFYFRAPKIAAIVSEMARSPEMVPRRLREGVEFFLVSATASRAPALKHCIA